MPLNQDTQILQIFSSPDKRQEYYSPFSKLDSIICYYELNLVMFINVKLFVQFVEIIDKNTLSNFAHQRINCQKVKKSLNFEILFFTNSTTKCRVISIQYLIVIFS